MLVEVARRGEESGYGVPCLLIAAKDDLDPYPMALQDSLAVYTSAVVNLIFAYSIS